VENPVVGEQLRLRSGDPLDVGRVELLVVDRLAEDEPFDLRQGESQTRRDHLLDVRFREGHGEPALREVTDRGSDERLDLVASGWFERPRQGESLEGGRDGRVGTGDEDRLADALGERELLEMPDDHRILQMRAEVVEHEDPWCLELPYERERLLGLLRVHL